MSAGPRPLAVLLPVVLALSVTALSPGRGAGQATGPVPASFFAVSPFGSNSPFPLVPMGTVGHAWFAWPRIEAVKDSFDFSSFDLLIDEASLRGLVDPVTNTVSMTMTLGLTPHWAISLADTGTCRHPATGGPQCAGPPDSLVYWTRFLTALMHHYDGTAHPHIRYYELWNEADDVQWWAPDTAGSYAQLVQLAQAAYPIIHQDPYSMLLTPSVTGQVTKMKNWMTGYLQAGGKDYADGGAFHGYLGATGFTPYPWPEDDNAYGSIITKVVQMRSVFDANGLGGKPMLQTEGSWGSFNVTDPDTMVAWIGRYELQQAGLRSTYDLEMAAWFAWADSSFGWGDIQNGAGFPNSAGVAYQQVFEWVVGATIAAPCSLGTDGVWTCTLTRPGGYTALAKWSAVGPTTYTPGAGYTRYRDLAGGRTAIPVGGSVPIDMKPVLIEHGAFTSDVPGGLAGPARLRASPSVTRSSTRLLLASPVVGVARVTIRDVAGRRVRTLAIGPGAAAGDWDGRDASGQPVASGLYFLRLESAGPGATARVVVVR